MVDEVKKPVRRMEKKVLNELMKSARFPLKLRVQEPHHKYALRYRVRTTLTSTGVGPTSCY